MITVSIGGMGVPAERASDGWIRQMMEDAGKRGVPLCVTVRIQDPDANLTLTTPGCGGAGGGYHNPNATEQRIVDAWNRRGFGRGVFTPGDLRAFLNELARLLQRP